MQIPLILWYLIITLYNGGVIIWRVLGAGGLIDFNFLLIVGGFLYFGYMFIIQLAVYGKSCNGCITAERTGFVQVHLAKYVISLSIGCLLIAYIVNAIIRGLFGIYGFEYLIVAYVNIVFPICCIVELFITPRDRSPKLIYSGYGVKIKKSKTILLNIGC